MRVALFLMFALGLGEARLLAGSSWRVRVEEPTGLYPRTNEIVAVPLAKLGQLSFPVMITDARGHEVPWQKVDDALLFPATLIPGELPEYRIVAAPEIDTNFVNQIHFRRLGSNRIEFGNGCFRVLIDLHSAAIVEAYNLTADPHQVVNLVETTPEEPDALKDDIHAA